MAERFQVIIVGGGPVGVGLAIDLGQRGIATALVERRLTPQPIPKGQNLTNRSMEHFYFWHCAEELRAARVLPPGYPTTGITAYGNLMSEYWYADQSITPGRGEGVGQFFFQSNERLPQYLTEEVLRARLRQVPSVTAYFGWQADRVQQDDGGVRVSIAPAPRSDPPDGRPAEDESASPVRGQRTLEADYIVGCDGGRSLVRESMGIERGGQDYDQRMLLAVFRSRELHAALARFPEASTFRVLKPELNGYWQFFGRVDVGEGFFFHAPVPRQTSTDGYDFQALLEEAAGTRFAADFGYVGFWDLRIMVASTYQAGRAFIAGDAAHQHPPYGGFGLNTGLEDAVNLAWKLAARLEGWGGPRLLESYTAERRPVFEQTGRDMIAAWIEHDRDWLQRYSPDKDKAAFERAWREHAHSDSTRARTYEPHYEGSPIVFGPPGGESGIHGAYSLRARPGHHLAPRRLGSGRNVYEELGRGFTLIALGVNDGVVGAFSRAAQTVGVPLSVIRDGFEGEVQEYGARLVLVRPDQHVAWTGDEPPADPAGVLRRLTGNA